jgi:hypothetical protein
MVPTRRGNLSPDSCRSGRISRGQFRTVTPGLDCDDETSSVSAHDIYIKIADTFWALSITINHLRN